MYQFAYSDIVEDSAIAGRAREHAAITRSIEMMQAAEAQGMQSRAAIDALLATQQLWSMLVEELAKPENELPSKLRADLISIGLWIFREVDHIRLQKTTSFKSLIEISSAIAEGLK